MFAAVAATLGDFGELWTANAGRAELALSTPPEWLIVPATLAGALGIPLYALGYFARARSLAFAAPQRARERLANPLVLTVGLTIVSSLLPTALRDIVSPAALNVAHVVFFASVAARERGAAALHRTRRMHS